LKDYVIVQEGCGDFNHDITKIDLVTQVRINTGICWPPQTQELVDTGDGQTFTGSITVDGYATYANWRFDITRSDDSSESCGIAAGLFIAAIHNMGLTTLTHTPSPMGFLRDILNRPEHEHAVLVMPVGYPDESAKVPNLNRKSLKNISEFIELHK